LAFNTCHACLIVLSETSSAVNSQAATGLVSATTFVALSSAAQITSVTPILAATEGACVRESTSFHSQVLVPNRSGI
jgi:hypothetical protein